MKNIITFLLIVSVVILSGCAHPVLSDPIGNCRNRAVYCALEAAEHYEVVIATGPTKEFPKTISHAQAKAKINNEWQWLYMMGEDCYIGNQESFIPLNEWSIVNYVKKLRNE